MSGFNIAVCAFFIAAGVSVYFARKVKICLNYGVDADKYTRYFFIAVGGVFLSFIMVVFTFLRTYERPSYTSSIGQEYCATVLKEWQVAQGGDGDIFGSNPVNTVWKIGLRDESGNVSSQVISDEDYLSIKVGDQVTVRREKSGFSTVMGGPVLVNRVYPGCKK